MRLCVSKSKNAASLYVIKTIHKNGKQYTKTVEKLGTYAELQKKLNGQDPIEWAKRYIEDLNKKEKEESREDIVKYSPSPKVNNAPSTADTFSSSKYTMNSGSISFARKYPGSTNSHSTLIRYFHGYSTQESSTLPQNSQPLSFPNSLSSSPILNSSIYTGRLRS